MRKGQLIKLPKKKFKTGDFCFDPAAKILFSVIAINGDMIEGQVLPYHNPCQVHVDTILKPLTIKDVVTGEEFPLSFIQHEYVYKSGYGDNLKFYTKEHPITKITEAVIYAKNIEMLSQVKEMSDIADAFGKYVAGQKAMSEPAQKFEDWFFDVSI